MAHVEVSKLSSQEVAELACTYAALILHDDEQDITGTHFITQEKESANSSLPLESRSSPTGPRFSLRLSKARTSVPFLTSEVLVQPLPQLHLPPWLLRKLRKSLLLKSNRRSRLLLLPLPLLLRKKTWIWATSLVDCLSDQ